MPDPGTYGVEYGILVSELDDVGRTKDGHLKDEGYLSIAFSRAEDPNDAAPKTTLSICGIFDFSRLVEVI